MSSSDMSEIPSDSAVSATDISASSIDFSIATNALLTPSSLLSPASKSTLSDSPAQLRMEVHQRQLETERVKREYMMKLAQAEETLLQERHQSEVVILQLQNQIRGYESRLQEIQQRTHSEIAKMKEKQNKIETERSVFHDRVLNIKEQLKSHSDFIISETTYTELKNQSADSLSIKDFVQIHVYEIVKALKEEIEQSRKEIDVLSENLQHTIDNNDKLMRNHQHQLKTFGEVERDLKARIATLETMNEQLSKYHDSMLQKYQLYKSKADNYDDMRSKTEDIENRFSKCEQQFKLLEGEYAAVCAEREQLRKQNNDIQQQNEIAKMDKMYLTKENESLTQRLQKLEEQAERQDDRVKELKKAKQELYEKLLSYREETKQTYHQKLQTEIGKIQEQTGSELERIKDNAKEYYARENRLLREAKDSALADCDRLKQQLREAKEALDKTLSDYRANRASLENQVTELKAEVKLKDFEIERQTMQYNETHTMYQNVKLEADVSRKKIDLLKSEYFQLQTETSTRIAELEANLAASHDKLVQYERMENDMDQLIVHTIGGISAATNGADQPNGLSPNTANSAPIGNRRIQHSLLLAKRIAELETRIHSLQLQLSSRDDQITTLNDQLSRAKLLASRVSQPYSYLLQAIEERERELDAKSAVIEQSEQQIEQLRNEKRQLVQDYQTLQSDLEELLENRDTVHGMAAALSRIIHNSNSSNNNNSNSNSKRVEKKDSDLGKQKSSSPGATVALDGATKTVKSEKAAQKVAKLQPMEESEIDTSLDFVSSVMPILYRKVGAKK